mgnify:CR=1 FL=1
MAEKTGKRSFEKAFLEKRLDNLQKFLTMVSEHEELKCSIYLSAFLKFSDNAQWTMMRNEMTKAYCPTSGLKDNYSKKLFEGPKAVKLSDFKSKDGTIRCRITKELRDYAISSEDLRKQSLPIYDKLKFLCGELSSDIDKVVETISKTCEQLNQLSGVHKRFNDANKEGKWDLVQRLYDIISTSLAKWGLAIRKNTTIINEHLTKTFKYSIKEYESVSELLKVRNQAGHEYYKSSQSLEALKEKLLQSSDPNKWEINFESVKMSPEEIAKNKIIAKNLMLPRENQIMSEMKNIFGYFNHMMVKELYYLANSRAKRYITAMNNFCAEQVEILEGQSSVFTNLKNNLFSVYEQLPEVKQHDSSPSSSPLSRMTVPTFQIVEAAGGDGEGEGRDEKKIDKDTGFRIVK